MKRIYILMILAVLLIVVAAPVDAMQQGELDFSRYNIILSRKPFGANAAPLPVIAPVAVKKVDPSKSFIKDYNMCAIRESLGGVSVGLVNIKAKPVRSFFLFEGDTEDGVLLVEANFREEKALLRKGGEECWISMSGAVRSAATLGGRMVPRDNLGNIQALISSRLERGRGQRKPFKVMSKDEYKMRLKRGDFPHPEPPRNMINGGSGNQKLTRVQLEEVIRKKNMDLIRAGGERGVPLPIPLTAEEDAQLVSEGVLSPR